MNQSTILESLRLFVEFEEKARIVFYSNQLQQLIANQANPVDIQKLDQERTKLLSHFAMLKNALEAIGGKCMGFSITHGIEDLSDKLDLWENMLAAVLDWDCNPNSLQAKIKSCNEQELRDIFWGVLSLVLFYQGSLAKTAFAPKGINQHKMMDYVQIIKDKKPYPLVSHQKVAGYLNEKQLSLLLDEEHINNRTTLCFLHSCDHRIRVTYKDSKWMLYDPNNKHIPGQTLKSYDNKQALIDTIFTKLSHSICIERASFAEKLPAIDHKLIMENPLELFNELGLSLMAKDMPQVMNEILDSLTINKPDLQRSLAGALLRKDNDGDTASHIIAQYAPTAFIKILNLMDSSEEGQLLQNNFIKLLNTDNSLLQKIFIYAPYLIPKLYKISHDEVTHLYIGRMLTRVVTSLPNKSGLEMMALQSPESLKELFQIAKQPAEEKLLDCIRVGLEQKNSTQSTLDIISRHAHSLLSEAQSFLAVQIPDQVSQPPTKGPKF